MSLESEVPTLDSYLYNGSSRNTTGPSAIFSGVKCTLSAAERFCLKDGFYGYLPF